MRLVVSMMCSPVLCIWHNYYSMALTAKARHNGLLLFILQHVSSGSPSVSGTHRHTGVLVLMDHSTACCASTGSHVWALYLKSLLLQPPMQQCTYQQLSEPIKMRLKKSLTLPGQ